MSEVFNSETAPDPVGAYPHARKVGNLLVLSGVGPRKKGSAEIPGVTLNERGEISEYDIAEQCHSVFGNVKKMCEDWRSNRYFSSVLYRVSGVHRR